jgi:hypothetical protein
MSRVSAVPEVREGGMQALRSCGMIAASAMIWGVLAPASGGAQLSETPGLESITFWEITSETTAFTLDAAGSSLTTRRSDPLGDGNRDFKGTKREFYDVYFSDAEGVFDLAGEFVTVTASFDEGNQVGGGLNLGEVRLNFESGAGEFGGFVTTYARFGSNGAEPGTAATDGDLDTHTALGNTSGRSERLSLTIGFRSTVELPAATPVVEVRNRSFPPLLATSVGQMFNRSLPAPTWFRVFEVHNRNVQDLPGADLGTVLAIQNDIDGSAPQDLSGDFDVNGVVELADFFLFAQAFGSSDLRFDLNGNDEVELGDFFVFADNFGRRTGP